MKLSLTCRHAIAGVAFLVAQEDNPWTPTPRIAEATGISERKLFKVLGSLASAKILESVPGPHGGYRLARPGKEITLLEVWEAIDGPIRGVVPFREDKPDDPVTRRLQALCDQAAEHMRNRLGKVKVADLP